MKFSVRPGQGDPSGFDLGEMVWTGDFGDASSIGHIPDQGMMIYPSVTLLLDSLAALLNGRDRVLNFTGVGTSFGIVFRRSNKEISVSSRNKLIARVSQDELARSVLLAAEELATASLAQLPEQDAVRADYRAALNDFRALAEGSATG
ncbi:hypothetical protein HRW16_14700 [Streptomyces lunaelactis]|uniref:hypothetical protein n=1 Tax=Streptomyces lunaelactis TaxID=1535768 RepID=UPI001584F632|nr:hypothetical protein [Streptomyces lunaelactis]NUK04318.1 hypothetical protein [Streptomyces lunaelactis]NUK18767.1 hypothetical protein [Streptomyces lunaelactis]NUK36015.1 hypothetical protein [Streptomyces lunaelactis]NUK44242.1 hypothetical protein [Streptomyces lunaelactis]NUK93077.1 hypothetical protein [Streptomyces lunaelactis]